MLSKVSLINLIKQCNISTVIIPYTLIMLARKVILFFILKLACVWLPNGKRKCILKHVCLVNAHSRVKDGLILGIKDRPVKE